MALTSGSRVFHSQYALQDLRNKAVSHRDNWRERGWYNDKASETGMVLAADDRGVSVEWTKPNGSTYHASCLTYMVSTHEPEILAG